MFFVMERFRENYTHESLLCMHMHMHGLDTHLRCANDKPTNTFCNTYIYGYAPFLRKNLPPRKNIRYMVYHCFPR